MAKKAVAKKEDASGMPSWMEEYKGEGQGAIPLEDIAMPRLKIGQSMSAEVKESRAEEGDLIHNITQEVVCKAGDTIPVIFIAYSKEYILWWDRNGPHQGGIAARAKRVEDGGRVRYMWDKPDQEFTDKLDNKISVTYKTAKFVDEDGLGDWGSQIPGDAESGIAAPAHHNYVLYLPEHDGQLIALSLSRTAERKAKEWNTMREMGRVPVYARIYKLGTFIDSSGDNTYANVQFTGFDLVTDQELFKELRNLHTTMANKPVNVDMSDEASGTASAPEGDEKF